MSMRRATITETLVPASASYQAWQTRQLLGIQAALAQASAHARQRTAAGG